MILCKSVRHIVALNSGTKIGDDHKQNGGKYGYFSQTGQ